MASETVVAVFPSLRHAEAAISDLVAAGVPSASIKHYARDEAQTGGAAPQSDGVEPQHRGGFWAWLTGEESTTATDHHAAYDRSIEQGRIVVTVVSDSSNVEQVYSVLERHDPLDLDDQHGGHGATTGGFGGVAAGAAGGAGLGAAAGTGREELVRNRRTGEMEAGDEFAGNRAGSGMTGGVDAVAPGAEGGITGTGMGAGTGAEADMGTATGAGRGEFAPRAASGADTTGTGYTDTDSTRTGAMDRDTARAGTTDEVIPLSEETLQVGKRAVNRGTTRIRRYVVERPVEEQIRLRDETVSVFRRPASGSATVGEDAFRDREVTVSETDEEAIVGKSARVVEEVVVQKGVQDRVETVRDTVRREEVEIDGPAASGTDAANRRTDPAI